MNSPRWLLLAALSLPLSACDSLTGSDPISLTVQFVSNHTRNADGTCNVQFAVQAAGIGTMFWERVAVREGTSVVRELTGAQTADYWGDDEIRAGERQVSVAFAAPRSGQDTFIEVSHRTPNGTRTTTLSGACPAA